jgi:hypothetical protein
VRRRQKAAAQLLSPLHENPTAPILAPPTRLPVTQRSRVPYAERVAPARLYTHVVVSAPTSGLGGVGGAGQRDPAFTEHRGYPITPRVPYDAEGALRTRGCLMNSRVPYRVEGAL